MHPLYTGSVLDVLLSKHAENTSGNLVVDGSFIVLANDVNAEFLNMTRLKNNEMRKRKVAYHDIVIFQFKRVGLDAFGTETFAVDECAIRTLDVFDEDLGRRKEMRTENDQVRGMYLSVLLPYFGMLSGEDF